MDIKKLLLDLAKSHTAAHINGAKAIVEDAVKPVSELSVFDHYLTAQIGKEHKKTLTLEAHIDQVAMIVTSVFEDGFLRVSPVGGIDARLLPATAVKIYGKEVVSGVFTSVPPHIKSGDTTPTFDDLFIDTGLKNANEIISAGDLVFFDVTETELKNNRFAAAGLDNKAGAAAVICAFLEIAKLRLPIKVNLLLTMGEELGLRGATVSAFNIDTDFAVAVDVSFGDFDGIPAHKTAKLGSGTMVGISPVLNKDIYKTLERLAKENNIPYTLEVMGGRTGTDADVISVTKGGIPTGLLSIPLRNMHSPVEVLDCDDILSTVRLLVLFAKEVAKNA